MLGMMILAASLTSSPVMAGGPVSSHYAESAHVRHLEHVAHLEHLHWLHLEHLARERSRIPDLGTTATPIVVTASVPSSSYLTCSGLEHLWDAVGGNPGSAFVAAEIAMAESSGYQYATGPYGERGFWQISTDHGSLSTYDPYGNARAAVLISQDGRNWSPWTTYVTGAYVGRCLSLLASSPLSNPGQPGSSLSCVSSIGVSMVMMTGLTAPITIPSSSPT